MKFRDLLEDTLEDLLKDFSIGKGNTFKRRNIMKKEPPKDFDKINSMNEREFLSYVKKTIKGKKNHFKFKYKPDKYITLKEALELKGASGEKRRFHTRGDLGNNKITWFGNFYLYEWYFFLKELTEDGLKVPVHLDARVDPMTVIEGNHRIQAMKQLGWNKVPVTLADGK